MPDNERSKQRLVDAKLLFLALRFSKEAPAGSEMSIRAITELRSYSKQHKVVRDRLRDLLKHDDIFVRILAAEALSVAGAYPKEAVPVLRAFLDYARKKNLVDDYQVWLGLCFLALEHYGVKALSALPSVLSYVSRQDNVRLKAAAVDVIGTFAKKSKASMILLRGLSNSKIPEVSERARSIVEGSTE